MSADVRDLRRRRVPMPIPASAHAFLDAFGIGSPHAASAVSMHLRRSKQGAVVFFAVTLPSGNQFRWNASAVAGASPPSFDEARKWAVAYAARYGQTITEVVKVRPPRGRKSEREALKAGLCFEAWLRSDVPALWAEAMMRCKHGAGFCGQDGFCHYGRCDMTMDEPDEPDAEVETEEQVTR